MIKDCSISARKQHYQQSFNEIGTTLLDDKVFLENGDDVTKLLFFFNFLEIYE
jgi:hypothetical protein